MIDILILPFRLFFLFIRFLFRPLSKWVVKIELEDYKRQLKNYQEGYKKKNLRIDDLEKICNKYKEFDISMSNIITHNKINHITITKNGEPIIISCYANNPECFDLLLNKVYANNHSLYCSKLGTHHWETGKMLGLLQKAGVDIDASETSKIIALCDISSREERKGYASALLEMLGKLSLEKGYRYIAGWLSYVDKENHANLKLFYEKNGFQVYLFENDEGVVIKYL